MDETPSRILCNGGKHNHRNVGQAWLEQHLVFAGTQNTRWCHRYDHDELVQTWVTHNLYVIGEATRAIASDSPDFKDQHPEIKWTEIIGMRTILAHRYFEIDPNALWAAVTQDLQDLKRSIDAILKEEEGQ